MWSQTPHFRRNSLPENNLQVKKVKRKNVSSYCQRRIWCALLFLVLVFSRALAAVNVYQLDCLSFRLLTKLREVSVFFLC